MFQDVRRLAWKTRKELTPFINKYIDIGNFFNDWGGSCLVCSWFLTKVLRTHGYKASLAIGVYDIDCHAFVMLDNKVIDITGNQFELPRVNIVNYKGSKYMTHLNDNSSRRRIKHWPESQRPNTYRRELKKIYERITE